jgi:hypothetical protein
MPVAFHPQGYCWRIQFSGLQINEFKHRMSGVFEFASSIHKHGEPFFFLKNCLTCRCDILGIALPLYFKAGYYDLNTSTTIDH